MIWGFCCTLAFWKHNSLRLLNRNKYTSSGKCINQQWSCIRTLWSFMWPANIPVGGTLTSPLCAEPHQKRVSAWAERQAHACFHFSHFPFGFCFFVSPQVPFRWIFNVKVFLFRIFHAVWACTAGCIGACLTVSGQLPMFSTKHHLVSSSLRYLMLHSAGKHSASTLQCSIVTYLSSTFLKAKLTDVFLWCAHNSNTMFAVNKSSDSRTFDFLFFFFKRKMRSNNLHILKILCL